MRKISRHAQNDVEFVDNNFLIIYNFGNFKGYDRDRRFIKSFSEREIRTRLKGFPSDKSGIHSRAERAKGNE